MTNRWDGIIRYPKPVICYYDKDGDPIACMNRKYMGGRILSSTQRCEGCEWEINDLFFGTNGKEIWQWYCSFSPVD